MADPLARQDSRSRQSRFLMPPRPLRIRSTGSGASLTPHLRVALLEPDIPQNTGTILRLAACLGVKAHIIEPAGFPTSDRAFRRAGMDYLDHVEVSRHACFAAFEAWRQSHGLQLVLLTTKAPTCYLEHVFAPSDILLLGRESSGVPEEVHARAPTRL